MPVDTFAHLPVAPACSASVLEVGGHSQVVGVDARPVLAHVVDGHSLGYLLPRGVDPCGPVGGNDLSVAWFGPSDLRVAVRGDAVGANPAPVFVLNVFRGGAFCDTLRNNDLDFRLAIPIYARLHT